SAEQAMHGPSQAASQQTPSAQKPLTHSAPAAQGTLFTWSRANAYMAPSSSSPWMSYSTAPTNAVVPRTATALPNQMPAGASSFAPLPVSPPPPPLRLNT